MSSFNAGQTTAGASSGAFTGLTGNKITLAQAGVLQSCTVFWQGTPGINIFLGVYADNAGVPGALLARSAVATSTGATQTLAMTTNPTLAIGNYWVVVQTQSGVNGWFDSGVGTGYFMGTPVWTGTSMPDPAPTGSTGAFRFSLYATFNTVVVTQSFPFAIADTSTVSHLDFHAGSHFGFTIADTSTVALAFHKTATTVISPPTVTTDPKREGRPILVAPSGIGANQTTKIYAASVMPAWEIGPIPGVLTGIGLNQITVIVNANPKPSKESGPKRL